jgi:hypothetical protein
MRYSRECLQSRNESNSGTSDLLSTRIFGPLPVVFSARRPTISAFYELYPCICHRKYYGPSFVPVGPLIGRLRVLMGFCPTRLYLKHAVDRDSIPSHEAIQGNSLHLHRCGGFLLQQSPSAIVMIRFPFLCWWVHATSTFVIQNRANVVGDQVEAGS